MEDAVTQPASDSTGHSFYLAHAADLRYISLDSLPKMGKGDVIFIAWLRGHTNDSLVAEKLYADLLHAGYQPQPVITLTFMDKIKFAGKACEVEKHQLNDNSYRHTITINPNYMFTK